MYPVSSAFIEATKNPVTKHRLTGTIGSLSFDESNIIEGSFVISKQSTDTSDVVLGSCYIGELQAEFYDVNITWSDWIGKVITPSFGLEVAANTWEDIPLGKFKIAKATHTANGVQVTAYDNMTKFDKKFKKSHFTNLSGLYDIISQLCTDSGVTLGMTQGEIEALPNGSESNIIVFGSRGKKKEFANDINTNRDLLFWCAQTMGCFATIDRSGNLVFKQYTQTVVDEVSDAHRIDGAAFEDYITHYIGIYLTNLDDNTEDYYGYNSAAISAEIQETEQQITADNTRIAELDAELVEWKYKLDHGQCTQEEYDEAVAAIDAELKPLQIEVKKLTKRLSWLQKAYEQAGDDGADMVLGANPLLMDSNLTVRDRERRAVLAALDAISYTPFTASVVCGAQYDLGDVIQFSGGLYNSSTDTFGCVMSWSYTHNGGTDLQGFGIDPALSKVRTKAQKDADRANSNSVDATRSEVGTIDPSNPPTADDAVPGKNGDMYVQETSKTIKKNVTKSFETWDCNSGVKNNLHWYSYGKITISSDSGNFVTIVNRINVSGNTWCVAGSVVRKCEMTYFVVKVPANDPAPNITAEISDVSEYNTDDRDKGSGGWGQTSAGTPFYFNPSSAVLNNDRTHIYYLASCAVGTFTGGLRYEVQEPDYIFDDGWGAIEEALKNDQIIIPNVYEGSDGQQQYYNDGTGGDSAWKKMQVVTGVDDTDEAGGTENNGLTVSETTQKLSLKKNVVRAWYKADPPQAVRNFSQLCVRYTGKPDNSVTIEPYASHHWGNIKIEKDAEGVYKIKCGGTKEANELNYAVYRITGLTSGKKYYFNFACDFANNATFNFDPTKGCGIVFNTSGTLSTGDYTGDGDKWYPATKYYAFKRQTNSWYADFELTAEANTMYMCILATALTDNLSTSITLSEFVLSQNERELIRNIYLYDYTNKVWLKYRPIGGAVSSGDEGGGSVVTIAPLYSQGTKIANYTIDGIEGSLYAPNLPIASASQLGGIKVGENLTIDAETGELSAQAGGVTDYDDLDDKPQINGVTLASDKTTRDLGIVEEITQAAYDALPSADKENPDKFYCLKDAGGGGGGGGGSSTLVGLTDVDISSPTDGQTLVYDATEQKWINGSGGGGGGYTRTELFKSSTDNAVWNASGIELSDSIENYDDIEIVLGFTNAGNTDKARNSIRYGAKFFAETYSYVSSSNQYPHALLLLWPNHGFSAAYDSTNKKIMMWGQNGTAGIWAVYGIKY